MLARAYGAGHNIGIHTWSHLDLVTLGDDQIVAELVFGAKAILEVTGGAYPKYFRPPYGSIDDRVRQLAATLGLHAVTWSHDTNDWQYVGTGNVGQVPVTVQDWMNQGANNGISLEHDLYAETVSVVAQNMDIIFNSGKTIVPLSQCIGDGD
ncbi:UNVERIFIED_CONTAM: chitin deacetylase cda1, partial [Siphonaria sp. JEL0065]